MPTIALQSLKSACSNKARPPAAAAPSSTASPTSAARTTQISGAGAARRPRRAAYSENAKGYLGRQHRVRATRPGSAPTPAARYSTVNQHFVNIDAAMDQSGGQIKINCGCNQNYYAYVYPTQPYEIFVCRAFWTAPTAAPTPRPAR